MEIQLQEIIEQIRKDGVEAAEAQAAEILENAKKKAEKIVSDANAEAEKIILNSKIENEKNVKAGEDSIRQAARNLLISFRESVTRELNVIINDKVNAVYSSDNFVDLIIKAVEVWTGNPDADDISVMLNSDDLKKLESSLLSELKAKMLSGVTIKANDNFDGGFRIAVDNGAVYYDYSAAAVTDMLSGYLSPKVAALLKEAE